MECFTDPWHLFHMSIWESALRNVRREKKNVIGQTVCLSHANLANPHYQLSELVTVHCPLLVPGVTLDPLNSCQRQKGRSETKKKKKHIHDVQWNLFWALNPSSSEDGARGPDQDLHQCFWSGTLTGQWDYNKCFWLWGELNEEKPSSSNKNWRHCSIRAVTAIVYKLLGRKTMDTVAFQDGSARPQTQQSSSFGSLWTPPPHPAAAVKIPTSVKNTDYPLFLFFFFTHSSSLSCRNQEWAFQGRAIS